MAKLRITQTTPYDSPQRLYFSGAKNLCEIPTRLPLTWAPNRGGVGSNRRFSTNRLCRYISETVLDIGTLLWKECALLNGDNSMTLGDP